MEIIIAAVLVQDVSLLAVVAVLVAPAEAPLQEEEPPGTPEMLVVQVVQELRPPL